MSHPLPDKQDEDLPGMLAVAKGIAEQRWPHTMDAAVWAAEFVKLHPDADEGSMLGWFANAIMAGYDTAQQRAAPSAIAPNVIELLRVAQCPACDGSGAIPHQIGEGDWELQQCQWCDERQQAVGPSDGGGA